MYLHECNLDSFEASACIEYLACFTCKMLHYICLCMKNTYIHTYIRTDVHTYRHTYILQKHCATSGPLLLSARLLVEPPRYGRFSLAREPTARKGSRQSLGGRKSGTQVPFLPTFPQTPNKHPRAFSLSLSLCLSLSPGHGDGSASSLSLSFLFFFLPGLGVTNDPQAPGPPDHLWFV